MTSAARYARLLGAVWLLIVVAWLITHAEQSGTSPARRGAQLFTADFTPGQGLGPLYNRQSCSGCHGYPSPGGVGPSGLATELRVGRLTPAGFDPMVGRGGPVARAHSVSELGYRCALMPGIPAGADVTSIRNTPPLYGDGLIDAIPDRVILARAAVERREGMDGRPNLVRSANGVVRVGRFGWKADIVSLPEFAAQALRNELGVTSAAAPDDFTGPGAKGCAGYSARPEAGASVISALVAFVKSLRAPTPLTSDQQGYEVFQDTGCAVCHTPVLEAHGQAVQLYSDLLLHDMGPTLEDHVVQEAATGREWRTAPLWGLSERTRYLHDGRATTLVAAILAHGGDAARARERFRRLSASRRRALLEFLRTR